MLTWWRHISMWVPFPTSESSQHSPWPLYHRSPLLNLHKSAIIIWPSNTEVLRTFYSLLQTGHLGLADNLHEHLLVTFSPHILLFYGLRSFPLRDALHSKLLNKLCLKNTCYYLFVGEPTKQQFSLPWSPLTVQRGNDSLTDSHAFKPTLGSGWWLSV